MKACMLAYTFYETDGRVRKYAESLVKHGYNVDVISLASDNKPKHTVLNVVNIYHIQKRLYNEKNKVSYLIKLIFFFLKSLFFVTKNHLKTPYDIIHVHSVPDFEVFATIIPKLLGAKIILDIHDPVSDFFSAKFNLSRNSFYVSLLNLIERMSALYSDHVITVTDYWSNIIKKRSIIPDSKISVIVNYPDTKMFMTEEQSFAKKNNDNFNILYPGTLNKHCGVDLIIKAISLLKSKIPNIRFHIYGSGNELNNLKLLVKAKELEDIIFFNGIIPLDDVPELMRKADVGIALLSGHNEYSKHALNVKLFEFLATGLPSIATRTESIIYYLGENNAMLSNPNDYTDIARCIKILYKDTELRIKLRKNGLQYSQEHNWENEMISYFCVVDNLINNKK